jgi:hypothetical protein
MSAITTTIENARGKILSNTRTRRGTVFAHLIDERRSHGAMQE